MGVVDPHGPPLSERHRSQPLAVARDQIQALTDVVDQLEVAGRAALEHEHRGDVHVRPAAALEVQEGGVQAREPVGVGHAVIVVGGTGDGKLQHAV